MFAGKEERIEDILAACRAIRDKDNNGNRLELGLLSQNNFYHDHSKVSQLTDNKGGTVALGIGLAVNYHNPDHDKGKPAGSQPHHTNTALEGALSSGREPVKPPVRLPKRQSRTNVRNDSIESNQQAEGNSHLEESTDTGDAFHLAPENADSIYWERDPRRSCTSSENNIFRIFR